MGKNVKMWEKMSVTDGLPAKRIEKLNNSEKKILSSNSLTTNVSCEVKCLPISQEG